MAQVPVQEKIHVSPQFPVVKLGQILGIHLQGKDFENIKQGREDGICIAFMQ